MTTIVAVNLAAIGAAIAEEKPPEDPIRGETRISSAWGDVEFSEYTQEQEIWDLVPNEYGELVYTFIGYEDKDPNPQGFVDNVELEEF